MAAGALLQGVAEAAGWPLAEAGLEVEGWVVAGWVRPQVVGAGSAPPQVVVVVVGWPQPQAVVVAALVWRMPPRAT